VAEIETVYMKIIGREHEMRVSSKWDWSCMLPSWTYNLIALDGWPGWHMAPGGEEPLTVVVKCREGSNSSRAIAIEFDDNAAQQFHYRDVTSDNLPWVEHGEFYKGVFSFQSIEDARWFHRTYGGEKNWDD
jgi:hypothetical protein